MKLFENTDKNELMTAILVSLISSHINDFSKIFTDDIILPLINYDIDGDGERDGKKLIDYQININGIKINVGKIIISIIQFFIVLYIINLIKKYI